MTSFPRSLLMKVDLPEEWLPITRTSAVSHLSHKVLARQTWLPAIGVKGNECMSYLSQQIMSGSRARLYIKLSSNDGHSKGRPGSRTSMGISTSSCPQGGVQHLCTLGALQSSKGFANCPQHVACRNLTTLRNSALSRRHASLLAL